uniref:WH1 domain-containing protein n=1 Tax=Panagrellus redivivus TaxID=6233 RepID=A0A7E4V6C4_PANRE
MSHTSVAASSSSSSGTSARMMNFTIVCDNETVNCHAEIPSNESFFLWLGQDSTSSMAYGLLKHRSVIYGQPSPHTAIQITEFADRLNRMFNHQRQVFVSTDIDKDTHSRFWGNLFTAMRRFIENNADFFKLDQVVAGSGRTSSISSSPDHGPATPASTISSDNSN